MNIKYLLPLQRVVGKIDNDFNIDNSDWIPRVAAWCIDALGIMKCTPYVRKKIKCQVVDGIVRCPKICNVKDIKVYTQSGCVIDRKGESNSIVITPFSQLNVYDERSSTGGYSWSDEEIAIYTGSKDIQDRLRVGQVCHDRGKYFVVIDDHTLEINFSAEWVVVEMLRVATYYDEYFNEDVPFVYDNALLLEALSWYCMMKILQRGYKHQVFSLSGQEPVNPYVQWNKLKDQAAASVKRDLRNPAKNEGWNNFFYNATFLPRG